MSARRFVLGTSALTKEQEASIIRWMDANAIEWWHWLPNMWLLKHRQEMGTAKIRDGIHPLMGNAECLVMEVQHVSWDGLTLIREGKRMSDWIETVWKTD
jgi:hypothetical protein